LSRDSIGSSLDSERLDNNPWESEAGMGTSSRVALVLAFSFVAAAVPSAWASWGQDGIPLCAAVGDQIHPELVSVGAGGAIVVWYDSRNGNADIYAQKVNAAGANQWTSDGVALCTAAGDQVLPAIASDGEGGAIVAWSDNRSGSRDIYARRISASGVAQWTQDGLLLCGAAGSQLDPVILPDESGGAIVAWVDYRSGNYDAYAQRVSASGDVLWTTNGVAVCPGAEGQAALQIISDGAGGAIIAWEDSRNGYWDVYAQRLNADGSLQWASSGVALSVAALSQVRPQMVSDGSGGAIVTWIDDRSGPDDIYAQRVNASGIVQWTTDGVPICTAMNLQWDPFIASDGAGGAIIVWRDLRVGDWNIYAQRVNTAGIPQWTCDGNPLCTTVADALNAAIAPDGAGGAIVLWEDLRSGNHDIYAQRVKANGLIQYTLDGRALCTASGDQRNPRLVSFASGAAIVTWWDGRSGNSDIYAQFMDAPLPPTDASTMPGPSFLSQNYPNPFNPTTNIAFALSTPGQVSLRIYDATGRLVRVLVQGDRPAGHCREIWDGRDDRGRGVSSGVYFYRLEAGSFTQTRKMILLR
jgi:hypothetical protein